MTETASSTLQRLADERAALLCVAELVAGDASPQEVLDAVAAQAAQLVGVEFTTLLRYGPDGATEIVAAHAPPDGIQVGMRSPAAGTGAVQRVFATGRPARIDDLAQAEGRWPRLASALGFRSSAATPVVVQGALWGALVVTGRSGPVPDALHETLTSFAALAGTAIASADARAALRLLVDEQSALRRVAELAARGAGEQEVCDAVVAEASQLMGDAATLVTRFEADGTARVVAARRSPVPIDMTISLDDGTAPLLQWIRRTGRPVRSDDLARTAGAEGAERFGITAAVLVPIIVADVPWGCLTLHTSAREPDPAVDRRLQQFADLAAAAIAGARASRQMRTLAEEQTALRVVAELVAHGATPDEVFAAVAVEASHLLGDQPMTLTRFEGGAELVVVAHRGGPAPVGARIAFEPDTLPHRVAASGRPTRVDDYAVERDAALAAEYGLAAAVAAPVLVEAHVWGMLTATSTDRPLTAGTEDRLEQFAELVGAAIANAESREQLRASRARVVATADDTRRRLQRDVHDGAQQRLVQTLITLKLARDALRRGDGSAVGFVEEALVHAERATTQLRDVVHGILPESLNRGGLPAGIESLVADLPLAVRAHVATPRLSDEVETTAYFVVAEALTNVVKHARARRSTVDVTLDPATSTLHITVGDDGVGGADPARGSGLTGLLDRVAAGDGTLQIVSEPGAGTTIAVALPATARPGA
jgi:signal transduction histidine kinase